LFDEFEALTHVNMLTRSNSNFISLDSPDFHQERFTLLSKIAKIGDWSTVFLTNTTIWSDYLYDFYELDKSFDCSTLLEATTLYRAAEKERMLALIGYVKQTKTECSGEFKVIMKDGRIKWHSAVLSPLLGNDGEVIGLYGVLQDISAWKQVENSNEKEQLLYRHILDKLPAELVVLNPLGRYIYANHTAIESKGRRGLLTGNRRERLSDLGNWIPAAESRRHEIMKECLTLKQPVTFEEKLTDIEGIERIYLRTIYPLLDENGEVELLIGYGMDITARKKSELELQRMAYVAEKTNGIVMITDPEKRIIWINNSFEKILGYKSEEVIGYDPGSFLQGPDTSRDTIKEITRSLTSTGTFSGEILNYTKSGEKIWLYLNIAAVYDDAGRLINYVAVQNDITLIKMAEQQLQDAMEKERELNRFKTQFVNLASHQFRTPLATISSSIDLLDLKMESASLNSSFIDFFRKHKAIMAEETIRMTELMENILDIGRIDEGKIELSKKKVSFKQFMDAFVSSNSESTGQKRKLIYRFEASDCIINLDEIVLRNVLRNVVSNAFKYSEGKQEPILTVTLADDCYLIKIQDFGIGIPESDQPFLFQSFFRASNAKICPGTGLGLMIAKKLISLHGGEIGFESKAGNGCTVSMQLFFE